MATKLRFFRVFLTLNFILLTILCFSQNAFAQTRLFGVSASDIVELNPTNGSIIRRIRAPAPVGSTAADPNGLAFDGTNLFWTNAFTTDRIFVLNPFGVIVRSFPVPAGAQIDGLAFLRTTDGLTRLYALNGAGAEKIIFVLDPLNGAVLNRFPAPPGAGGLGGDGRLFMGDFTNGQVHEFGLISLIPISTFNVGQQGIFPAGVAFDGIDLFLSNLNDERIFVIDPSRGSLRRFFLSQAGPLDALAASAAAAPPAQPDLTVTISGPPNASAGQPIGSLISVSVTNKGTAPAASFFVDIVISADTIIDSTDRLLIGGRESVASLSPGQTIKVPVAASASIPLDIPPGSMSLGAIVDSQKSVPESDEANNTASVFIRVTTAPVTTTVLPTTTIPGALTITAIILEASDEQGTPIGGEFWDTIPANGLWQLGVVDAAGNILNKPDTSVIIEGVENRTFSLFASDGGRFPFGKFFKVTVVFSNGRAISVVTLIGAPPRTNLGVSFGWINITKDVVQPGETLGKDGKPDGEFTLSIGPSLLPEPTQGLRGEYFNIKQSMSTLKDFITRVEFGFPPAITRVDKEINFPRGFSIPFTDFFGVIWTGSINIPVPGEYTFILTSDDGSRLFIDGKPVVDNDGLHGMVDKQGIINLTTGPHPIRIEFFENGGGEGIVLSFIPPGGSRIVVPSSTLSSGPAVPVPTTTAPPTTTTIPPTTTLPPTTTTTTPAAQIVAAIQPDTIKVGETSKILAISSDPGDVGNFNFISMNPNIAAVDATGVVTGLAEGTAIIEIQGGKSGASTTVTITVVAIPVTTTIVPPSIQATITTDTINVGGTAQILAISSVPTDVLSFTSDNPTVVTVDSRGVVRGVAPGTATITIKGTSGAVATIKVTVSAPPRVTTTVPPTTTTPFPFFPTTTTSVPEEAVIIPVVPPPPPAIAPTIVQAGFEFTRLTLSAASGGKLTFGVTVIADEEEMQKGLKVEAFFTTRGPFGEPILNSLGILKKVQKNLYELEISGLPPGAVPIGEIPLPGVIIEVRDSKGRLDKWPLVVIGGEGTGLPAGLVIVPKIDLTKVTPVPPVPIIFQGGFGLSHLLLSPASGGTFTLQATIFGGRGVLNVQVFFETVDVFGKKVPSKLGDLKDEDGDGVYEFRLPIPPGILNIGEVPIPGLRVTATDGTAQTDAWPNLVIWR